MDSPQPDVPPVPGEFRYPCIDGADCTGGFCVPSEAGRVCSKACVDTCPAPWVCSLVNLPGQDPTQICLQPTLQLCRPCMDDEDCTVEGFGSPGGRCVPFGPVEGSFCGTECSALSPCPSGFVCESLTDATSGQSYRQCLPEGGSCGCSPLDIAEDAFTTCNRGLCKGLRRCMAEGLSDCDAAEPTDEVCDNADNDCDGDTDEDVAPKPCKTTGPLGVCNGLAHCVSGERICDAPDAVPEACDGEDNDCNGETDEGFEDTDQDGTADCVDLDDDDDGVLDGDDNCPLLSNPEQLDNEPDGQGDLCDPDDDNDGIEDGGDDCPRTFNPNQEDADGDGTGDACDPDDDNDSVPDLTDNCPLVSNPDQADSDGDGDGDVCDGDKDGDGVANDSDNCPLVSNTGQENNDGDGSGDACDSDDDNDGVLDGLDNCPMVPNGAQDNHDDDSNGDACDPDDDNDGVPDYADNCPFHANTTQVDSDGDGPGDACDPDDDNDGVLDVADNCRVDENPDQADNDGDGVGDICDDDDDDDGVKDLADNCPNTANPDQKNNDKDTQGDVCDPDDDNDAILDDGNSSGVAGDAPCNNGEVAACDDNCPFVANQDQKNSDGSLDGGDACDDDDDDDLILDPFDCAPTDPTKHPYAPEVCNGEDDNCNTQVDEAPPASMCPPSPNAGVACVNGACVIASCGQGWHDLDRAFGTGCECNEGAAESEGKSCNLPKLMPSVEDDKAQTRLLTGRIVPADDEDWFAVPAIDAADTSCDKMYVDIRFTANPGSALVFDVYRGACGGQAQICIGALRSAWATDFSDLAAQKGQCPCIPVESGPPTDNIRRCEDDSSTFYVRVYRKPGFSGVLPCADYAIAVSNGVYKTK